MYVDLNPVCIDYALSNSADGYASEIRVSTQSSNPYVQFSGSFIGVDKLVFACAVHERMAVVTADKRLALVLKKRRVAVSNIATVLRELVDTKRLNKKMKTLTKTAHPNLAA